jgi:hypothetical protein
MKAMKAAISRGFRSAYRPGATANRPNATTGKKGKNEHETADEKEHAAPPRFRT